MQCQQVDAGPALGDEHPDERGHPRIQLPPWYHDRGLDCGHILFHAPALVEVGARAHGARSSIAFPRRRVPMAARLEERMLPGPKMRRRTCGVRREGETQARRGHGRSLDGGWRRIKKGVIPERDHNPDVSRSSRSAFLEAGP
jgi:hypothetical protein